ncbi:MAG: DUF1080 domain-containing protein [Bacteroidetes bacterium]|nr:MAG: DUF1080 domain-containing protein [Bacteroidota bacterium]
MNRLHLIFFLPWLACSTPEAEAPAWELIFNGRDLSGWTPKLTGYQLGDNYGETFRVEAGELRVSYAAYDSFRNTFGHLFYHEKLSHFKLRLEYRFTGEQVPGAPAWAYRNSGIKFHAPDPALIPRDQQLLVAIEAQLLGGNGSDSRPTANVCTAGTHIVMGDSLITQHCTNSSSPTFHGDQWVAVEIEVHGHGQVIHRVNGEEVLRYEQAQLDEGDRFARALMEQGHPRLLREGYIALQAESHPVAFRHIELMRLPAPEE